MSITRIAKILSVCLSLSLIIFNFTLPMAASAVTYNPQYIANVGDPCSLLLGDSQGGIIQSDGHTCCPKASHDASSCIYDKYINPLIQLTAAVVGVAVVATIIYGGIEYTTSAGDPQRVASGRKKIVSAIVGLVAFALLYAFLNFMVPGNL